LVTEHTVAEWLVDTSLERFELWSGADEIWLSPQLQIEYGRFHNLHSMDSTRHRYSFRRDVRYKHVDAIFTNGANALSCLPV
jgi:hypothetical protein